MLKKLSVALSMAVLIMAMPVFASAEVELPNEVLPMKTTSDGMDCPQLDYGAKVVQEGLTVKPNVTKKFTASINSIIWNVVTYESIYYGERVRGQNLVTSPQPSREKYVCEYAVVTDLRNIRLKLYMNEKRARYIKNITSIIEDIKKEGVMSRSELLGIINHVMPR